MDVVTDLVWTGTLLSLTEAVKLAAPLVVGMPEIVPVVAASVNPAGSAPAVTDQV
jgi:hypothetical protein